MFFKSPWDHFILNFYMSFFCRMETWFVLPFNVLPYLVQTLSIVLETVAHGNQPAIITHTTFPPASVPFIHLLMARIGFRWENRYNKTLTYSCVGPVGVSSVSMSPKCMRMDRRSPPGETPAHSAAAPWVHFLYDWYRLWGPYNLFISKFVHWWNELSAL